MSYATQGNWRNIQKFLPKELHFTPDYCPAEAWWPWKGHQIHVDRFSNPDAKAKVILFHGMGFNGRHMSMILGGPLWRRGLEAVAIDLPGYGLSQLASDSNVAYDDWVELANDFVNAELTADPRPIVLFGLSSGGMLTYHVAALNPKIKGIVGTAFLDQREQRVRDETSYNLFMSRVGAPFSRIAAQTPLGCIKLPIRLASKMRALVNDPAVLDVFLKDETSAGNWVTIKFLSTYLSYKPAVEPDRFSTCPILLTQPTQDRWTPLHVSKIFLDQVHKVLVEVVMLENASHLPIEPPGLYQLHDSVAGFAMRNALAV